MERPIREFPVLKGEDTFNFEMRRLEVENMSKEHPDYYKRMVASYMIGFSIT